MKKILAYILGTLLLLSAIAHIVTPETYRAMIPEFIPVTLANVLAALTEAAIGFTLISKYRAKGALFFMVLMILFLPIHIWDLFRETPAIGQHPAPVIRLVIQFCLIYVGGWLYKNNE